MADSEYAYYPRKMTDYEPRAQPYPYPSHPQPQQQQQQQQQQVYGQAHTQVGYSSLEQGRYVAYGHATSSPRPPLPPPPRSPLPSQPPSSYGHTPQIQYQHQHLTYSPSSFDPRYTQSGATPALPAAPLTRRPLPDPRVRPGDAPQGAQIGPPRPTPSPGPRVMHRPALSVSAVPTVPASMGTPTSPQASPPKTTTSVSPPRPLPQPQPQAIPRSFAHPNLARSPSPSKGGRPDAQQAPPPPATPTGHKFVPHWRRALPAPRQQASSSMIYSQQSQPIERRSTVTGSEPPPVLQRQIGVVRPLPQSPAVSGPNHERSSSAHPLPPVPTASQRAQAQQPASPPRALPRPHITMTARPASPASRHSAADSSDGEDLNAHVLLSRPSEQGGRPPVDKQMEGRTSPQYGILDMPSRTHVEANGVQGADGSKQVQSTTMRFAAMSVQEEHVPQGQSSTASVSEEPSSRPQSRAHGYSQSVPNASTAVRPHPMPPMTRVNAQPGVTRWPAGLPPLPRTPALSDGGDGDAARKQSIFGRPSPNPGRFPELDLSLDDAPPPSLRRSPSPARMNDRTTSAGGDPTVLTSAFRGPERSFSSRPAPPASIRTHALNAAPSPSTAPLPFSSRFANSPLPSAPRTPSLPPSRPNAESPASATPPSSAASIASVFTLSSFPQPPSSIPTSSRTLPSPQPKPSSPSVASPLSAVSPTSASSTSSAFTLSSFPKPPSHSRSGSSSETVSRANSSRPEDETRQAIPKISFPANADDDDSEDSDGGFGPVISVSGPDESGPSIPTISVGLADDEPSDIPQISLSGESTKPPKKPTPLQRLIRKGPGLMCGGCGGTIVGRTVSAMGARWHPGCFRCCVCDELLEHLSSYEHEGRAYCHLDYHELFAPKCYHCKTAIADERFITLDDPELGKRTYHEQHFFCAECGDPFLAPSLSSRGPKGEQTFAGDGEFNGGGEDDVGFTVYRGHPYCEACHVRLRLPKCKRCKKAIRDGKRAVEALGGKWCWECFVCESCERPFEDPSFFQRDGKPFCEHCFSIMIKNEM